MQINYDQKINTAIESIKDKNAEIKIQSLRLKQLGSYINFDKTNSKSCCLLASVDILERLSLLIKRNFDYIETIGLVAVARYIFEISIWLKLFSLNSQYGSVYYYELMKTQKKYYKDFEYRVRNEIETLSYFSAKEKGLIEKQLKESKGKSGFSKAHETLKDIANIIDNEASRNFSLYNEQAKDNGYDFQAHMVKTKILPKIQDSITDIENSLKSFEKNTSLDFESLMGKHWNWFNMAEKVGMEKEYRFIYSFTSKLLHASPVSITTEQKNLEKSEILMFLKFRDIKLFDAIDLAKNQS